MVKQVKLDCGKTISKGATFEVKSKFKDEFGNFVKENSKFIVDDWVTDENGERWVDITVNNEVETSLKMIRLSKMYGDKLERIN